MLMHYFVAGLKPLCLGEPPSCSLDEFMNKARESLEGDVLHDLELLLGTRDFSGQDAQTRREYWRSLIEKARIPWLKDMAREMVNVYEVLAALVAKKNALSFVDYEKELFGQFDSTASMISRHYETPNFSLASRHAFMLSFEKALSHEDPMVLERVLAEYFFHYIDDILSYEQFSAQEVLAYFIKLKICERFLSFNEQEGSEILSMLINNVREHILA